jgi:uncharacterized protein
VVYYARPIFRIVRSKGTKRIRFANAQVERIAPHTRSELLVFLALSLSAGLCEEFVFRGYLLWAFRPPLGLWGAAGFALVVFAAAHAYQGLQGVLATAIVGAVMTLVVLVFDSLLPAMILHALIDINQGLLGWLVLREVSGAGDTQ